MDKLCVSIPALSEESYLAINILFVILTNIFLSHVNPL